MRGRPAGATDARRGPKERVREDVLIVDAHFGVPRLAQFCDALNPIRADLDAYLGMVSSVAGLFELAPDPAEGSYVIVVERIDEVRLHRFLVGPLHRVRVTPAALGEADQ